MNVHKRIFSRAGVDLVSVISLELGKKIKNDNFENSDILSIRAKFYDNVRTLQKDFCGKFSTNFTTLSGEAEVRIKPTW